MVKMTKDSRRPCRFVVCTLMGLSGCASVPRSQMEETRQQVVSLRAELAQSKDLAQKFRTQNREISARAVEDARRIASLEGANQALEDSVLAYQDEREKYAASLRAIQNEVLASATSRRPSAMKASLDRFLADHPECTYDASKRSLSIAEDDVFEKNSETFTAKGESLTGAIASLLAQRPDAEQQARLSVARDGSAVRLASTSTAEDLPKRRADALRSRLAKASGLPAGRISSGLRDDATTPPDASRTVRIDFGAAAVAEPGS